MWVSFLKVGIKKNMNGNKGLFCGIINEVDGEIYEEGVKEVCFFLLWL